MATQYVCYHNKYGYCKYKEECRKRHVNLICDDPACDIRSCESRHPKNCKFYIQYGRCKFDPCAFLHVENNNNIQDLKKENEQILKQIENMDTKIKEIDKKIAEQNLLISKIQELAEKMESFKLLEDKINEKVEAFDHRFEKLCKMEQTLGEKESLIKILNEKVSSLENLAEKVEKISDKISNIKSDDIVISEMEQTFVNPSTSIISCDKCEYKTELESDLEKHITDVHKELFKCEYCDFVGKTEGGLKTHTRCKHTKKMVSPVQNRGQFSPRCPPRLPPRFPQSFPPFPMSPYDV